MKSYTKVIRVIYILGLCTMSEWSICLTRGDSNYIYIYDDDDDDDDDEFVKRFIWVISRVIRRIVRVIPSATSILLLIDSVSPVHALLDISSCTSTWLPRLYIDAYTHMSFSLCGLSYSRDWFIRRVVCMCAHKMYTYIYYIYMYIPNLRQQQILSLKVPQKNHRSCDRPIINTRIYYKD